jgi:MFS family permease
MAGPLADGLGRKKGMFVANIVVIVGSVIQSAAFRRRDMIVGRVILGIGSVLLGPSAQSYTVEISHPAYRGVMMGLYNGCYFIGAIVSTCASTFPHDDRMLTSMQGSPTASSMTPRVKSTGEYQWLHKEYRVS